MFGASEAAGFMLVMVEGGQRLSDETSCQKPNMHDSLLETTMRESADVDDGMVAREYGES